jgi:hypothetical protein
MGQGLFIPAGPSPARRGPWRGAEGRPGGALLAKAPGRGASPTPEQIAKKVTDRDPSPIGQLAKAAITLRLVLPRAILERLRVRAVRETRKLEAIIQEILEGAAAR